MMRSTWTSCLAGGRSGSLLTELMNTHLTVPRSTWRRYWRALRTIAALQSHYCDGPPKMARLNISSMAAGTDVGNNVPGGVPALLEMVSAHPREAIRTARAILARDPVPFEASIAHQTIGLVLRDFGDLDAAIRELRAAHRLAGAARSQERQADVLAALGNALIHRGRTKRGLAALDSAL